MTGRIIRRGDKGWTPPPAPRKLASKTTPPRRVKTYKAVKLASVKLADAGDGIHMGKITDGALAGCILSIKRVKGGYLAVMTRRTS